MALAVSRRLPRTDWSSLDPALGSILARKLEALDADWFAVQATPEPPRVLHHYTTPAGMLGIIQSNRLHATEVGFMNDRTELDYASALLREVVLSLADAERDEARARRIRGFESSATGVSYRFYIGCFCENGDLLSQWRAYGARGGGYSLGIRTDLMTHATPYLLRRVIYDQVEQRRLIETAIRAVLDAWDEAETGRANQSLLFPHLAMFLREYLAELSVCFKHPTFKEEAEWRVVRYATNATGDAELNFRSTPNVVVPYVPLDLRATVGPMSGRLPIEQIGIGPTLDTDLAKDSVAAMLSHYGHTRANISLSQVPLRG